MILITGASGLVGRQLLTEFMGMDAHVGLFIGQNDVSCNFVGINIRKFYGDICSWRDINSIPRELVIDIVIHLAAYTPPNDDETHFLKCFKVNVGGTQNILRFCRERGVRKVIYISSLLVYKDVEKNKLYSENSEIQPSSYYGITKYISELLLLKYEKEINYKLVILRSAYIFGDSQKKDRVIPLFFKKAKDNNEIVLANDFKKRDYIYVKDITRAIMLFINSESYGVYNVGSGASISIKNIAEKIIFLCKSKSKIIKSNSFYEPTGGIKLSNKKIYNEFEFKPIYSFDAGLADYFQNMERDKNQS